MHYGHLMGNRLAVILALLALLCSLFITKTMTAFALEAKDKDMTAIDSGLNEQSTDSVGATESPQKRPAPKNGAQPRKDNFIKVHKDAE